MTDLEMWSALVAFFLPTVIALAQQPHWPGPVRVGIMLGFCLLAAAVTAALQGKLNWDRWFHSLLYVAIGTIAFYHGVWKPSGVAKVIEQGSTRGKHEAR